MFRMIVIGFFSFIGISLFALQGMATYKKHDNFKKGVLGTVDLYKATPFEAQRLTNVATKACLEDRSGGELPSYYTEIMADSAAAAFRFASENEFESTEDANVKQFVSEMKQALEGRINDIAGRMAKEPESLQVRLNASLDWLNGNRKTLINCVGLKVVRLAAAAEQ